MDEPIRNVHGTQPPGSGPAPGAKPVQGTDSTDFRRLLEKLESLSRNTSTPTADGAPVTDSDRASDARAAADVDDSPEDLARDLAKADEEFESVMDLRRRLEDAFRRLGP